MLGNVLVSCSAVSCSTAFTKAPGWLREFRCVLDSLLIDGGKQLIQSARVDAACDAEFPNDRLGDCISLSQGAGPLHQVCRIK